MRCVGRKLGRSASMVCRPPTLSMRRVVMPGASAASRSAIAGIASAAGRDPFLRFAFANVARGDAGDRRAAGCGRAA